MIMVTSCFTRGSLNPDVETLAPWFPEPLSAVSLRRAALAALGARLLPCRCRAGKPLPDA